MKENKKCLFCDIISNEELAHRVFENEHSLAFLDKRPLFPGHCLLIPRDHYETLLELPPSIIGPFFLNVQLLAKAVEKAMKAEGTFVAINNKVSQSVPHLHIHIVPRKRKDGLRGFFWPRNKYKDEQEMEEVRNRICQAIRDIGQIVKNEK